MILQENGDQLLLESGDTFWLEGYPIINSVNGGNPISPNNKSLAVYGLDLGTVFELCNNADYNLATMKVAQSVQYSFNTMLIFDVVQGDLGFGTVYAFSTDSLRRNSPGFPVTLAAETMPASTVAADAVATLTTQFDNAAKTQGFLEALLSPFGEIDSAVQYLNDSASFLHGAAGTWLDSEGKIIGAKRDAFSTPENLFFTFAVSREGGAIQKSYTQGFNCGYLRSLYGNELQGTQVSDIDYLVSLEAKALATFRGSSLCDIEDWIYNLFDIVCLAEFDINSDVTLTFSVPLTWQQKLIVQKYAPIPAGSALSIVEI